MSGFVKLPQEHAESWYALRYPDRAIGADMYRVFGNDEIIDVPIDQVVEVLCRALAVDGRDRPSFRRSIQRIINAGLLVPDGPRTRLLYSRRAYREWTANDRPTTSECSASDQSMTAERPVNDRSSEDKSTESFKSGPVDREIDREKERERSDAREAAQPFRHELEPDRWPAALACLRAIIDTHGGRAHYDPHSWRRELLAIAAKPESDRAHVFAAYAADAWVRKNPGKAHPGHLLKHWDRYRGMDDPTPTEATDPDAQQPGESFQAWIDRRNAEHRAQNRAACGGATQ